MKINMHELNEYLGGLTNDDPAIRQKSARGLAKYSNAEWQGTPDAITAAVPALVSAARRRGAASSEAPARAEATKALGNIGGESPTVVSELLRILQDDAENTVRTEAAHGLGKIGERATTASRALASVIGDPAAGDILRG